jgi:uracil phosphoribosyltransferase
MAKNEKNQESKTAAETAKAAKVAAKAAAKAAAAKDTRPVPVIRDADGLLKKLRRADFPKSRIGKIAFCDYQIARWETKKANVDKATDPQAKAKKRRERLLKQLAALDEEMSKATE